MAQNKQAKKKEPIRNMEQANIVKKHATKLIIIGLAIGIPSVILAIVLIAVLGSNSMIPNLAFIPAFVGLVIVFIGVKMQMTVKKLKKKFADLECPKCHTRIAYTNDVKYTVLNTDFKVRVSEAEASKGVNITIKGTETKNIEITCKCQKCGTEKKFTHLFTSATCSKTENTSRIEAGATKIRLEQEIKDIRQSGFQSNYGFKVSSKSDDSLLLGYFGDEVL